MSAIGVALILNTSYEVTIAANVQRGQEGVYAVDAAVERALGDLQGVDDWDDVLGGAMRSGFTDGVPGGPRRLPDGTSLDLGQVLNLANCQKARPCTPANLVANTASRPWGANNPVWVLYAYGPLAGMLPNGTINSRYYVLVMVADDPSENDDNPLRDGTDPNPGSGRLAIRPEAFGPRSVHKIAELIVSRSAAAARVQILSWREVR
jgi:hypothetical protein